MAIGYFTLSGTYLAYGDTPASGTVQIDGVPSQVIVDTAGDKIKVGPKKVTLDTSGSFSIQLPTDATSGDSTAIGYRVTARLKHANVDPVTFFAKAASAAVDMADVTTVAAIVPAVVTQDFYKNLARTPDVLIAGTITRDANGAATSAPVVWPDGSPGTYTALTVSTAFPGAVDSYKITYGSPVTKTYTQPAVTRDSSSGAATNVPAIVVS